MENIVIQEESILNLNCCIANNTKLFDNIVHVFFAPVFDVFSIYCKGLDRHRWKELFSLEPEIYKVTI